jgi:hypothetical protein
VTLEGNDDTLYCDVELGVKYTDAVGLYLGDIVGNNEGVGS